MSWHGYRKKLKAFFCPALAKRLDVHITTYRRDDDAATAGTRPPGRGWVTLDGEEIFRVAGSQAAREPGAGAESPERQDLFEAVESYPQLAIEDALRSPSPIVRAFALADRRLGKRRLAALDVRNEHELVRALYRVRCAAEGIEPREDGGNEE